MISLGTCRGSYPGARAAPTPRITTSRDKTKPRDHVDYEVDHDMPPSATLGAGDEDIVYVRMAQHDDPYRRDDQLRRRNDDEDIVYARMAQHDESYRCDDQFRRRNDDFIDVSNSRGFDEARITGQGLTGSRSRAHNEPRTLGLNLEALTSKKHIQTFLVGVSHMTDRNQRYAQGATKVSPDGRYYLLLRAAWIAETRDNPTDLRSER
jgi:hypothetical protein